MCLRRAKKDGKSSDVIATEVYSLRGNDIAACAPGMGKPRELHILPCIEGKLFLRVNREKAEIT